MSVFEHSFSLIGLVLGLALVEVLGALVRALKQRHTIRIGWLTPMLAIFVILDTTTFWGIVYENRNILPSIWPTLGLGLALSATYYAAASMVFPDRQEDWSDLDGYFMRYKLLVLGMLFGTFVIVLAAQIFFTGRQFSFSASVMNVAYLVLLLFTALVPWRKACVAGLAGLIAVDVSAFMIP